MKTSLLFASFLIVILMPLQSNSQVIRNFNLIYSDNIQGGHTMFGNTSMAIYSSGSGSSGTVNTTLMNRFGSYSNSRTSDESNDQNNMQFLDVDGDASTSRSSAADMILPAGTNTIKFARLYWGGRVLNSDITASDANLRTIKLKGPIGAYTTFVAPVSQLDKYDISSNSKVYQTYLDITSLVSSLQAGTYTVADMAGSAGNMGGGGGYFNGWTIVVAFENTNLPYSSVRIYDGYLQVFDGGSIITRSVTLNGLNAPTGTLALADAYLSVMAWEGDASLAASSSNPEGDYLKINGSTFSNTVNPAANMWNGTISKNGAHVTAKNPNYLNQFGIDIDEFQVGGQYGIVGDATTVLIEFGTEADQYFPSLFAFTMRMKDPQIRLNKTVTDANSNNKVQQNEILTYTLDGFNIPSAPGYAYNNVVTDTLPFSVSYVKNSLKIWDVNSSTWSSVTDISGDDIGKFDSVNTINGKTYFLRVYVGEGATVGTGGYLLPGQHSMVQFQVQAKASISVVNTARMISWNQALTEQFSDDGFVALPGDQAPLPVRLVSFSGIYEENSAQLYWEVASEDNTAYYEVQRSPDGSSFNRAGIIEVNGSSVALKSYTFTDYSIHNQSKLYYRLAEMGMNGKQTFSNTIQLQNGSLIHEIAIYGANPFTNFVQVQVVLREKSDVAVRLVSQNGQLISIRNFKGQKGTNLLRIDDLEYLQQGVYLIEVSTAKEKQILKAVKK